MVAVAYYGMKMIEESRVLTDDAVRIGLRTEKYTIGALESCIILSGVPARLAPWMSLTFIGNYSHINL